MENISECVEAKTPRRTRRRTLATELEVSKKSPSSKNMKLQDIGENADAQSEPKTPSRSSKQLDCLTPIKSEAMPVTQTPRRSVRKSVKPVQEYESIVAQKGLKRATISTVDDEAEGKWIPAVVGRASTKRNKQSARGKGKRLKRHRRVTEDSEDNDEEVVEIKENDLESEGADNLENDHKNIVLEEQFPKAVDVVLEKENTDSEMTTISREELHAEQNEMEPSNRKKETGDDQVKNDEYIVEKENIGSEHVSEQHSDDVENRGLLVVEEKVDEDDIAKNLEDFESTTNPNLDSTSGVHSQEEASSAKANEVEAMRLKALFTEETDLANVVKNEEEEQVKKIEEQENDCEGKSAEPEAKHKDEIVEVIVDLDEGSVESADVELVAMPVTADDNMESPNKEVKSFKVSKNENADDSDCIMLSLDETLNSETEEPIRCSSAEMPSLVVSGDEDELESNKQADIKVSENYKLQTAEVESRLDGTFDANQSTEESTALNIKHTPVLRPSISRIQTPFKLKTPIIPDIIIIESEENLQSEEPPIILEGSRETRIKSARKRSFSVCEDRPKKNVTFCSPANVTVSIYDGDLMNSCIKADSPRERSYRKRSLSVTETEQEMLAYIKEKKSADTSESKKSQHVSKLRTKMPNFSAIHQQQFQRMESISDHVARKAERAKGLTNSALKANLASVQKGLVVKNSVLRDSNKDSSTKTAMPKARQRIELSGIEHKQQTGQMGWLNVGLKIRTKSKNDLTAFDGLSSIDKLCKFDTNRLVFSGIPKPKLLKPKMDMTVSSTSKTLTLSAKKAKPFTAATKETKNPEDCRPKFNLSTAPDSQSFRSTEALSDRRKRHMEMFKSRNPSRIGEKNKDILKGVRTNRRFELQMMCRNRPN